MESVQRIVLAASRPKSVGEPEDVLPVDASRTVATACWTILSNPLGVGAALYDMCRSPVVLRLASGGEASN
jgi:hypothetical protein